MVDSFVFYLINSADLVYDAKLQTRAKELLLLMIDEQRVKQLSLSVDDDYDSSYPDLGISAAGAVALTWFDERDGNQEVYLSTSSLAELQAGSSLHGQRITYAPSRIHRRLPGLEWRAGAGMV